MAGVKKHRYLCYVLCDVQKYTYHIVLYCFGGCNHETWYLGLTLVVSSSCCLWESSRTSSTAGFSRIWTQSGRPRKFLCYLQMLAQITAWQFLGFEFLLGEEACDLVGKRYQSDTLGPLPSHPPTTRYSSWHSDSLCAQVESQMEFVMEYFASFGTTCIPNMGIHRMVIGDLAKRYQIFSKSRQIKEICERKGGWNDFCLIIS